MQVVKITKLNVQEGIRLIKKESENLGREVSKDDLKKSNMLMVVEAKLKETDELVDVLVYGKAENILKDSIKPKMTFNVETYFEYVDKYGTESVAKITDTFYKFVQDKVK